MRLVTWIDDAGRERPGAVIACADGDRRADLSAMIPGGLASAPTVTDIVASHELTTAARAVVSSLTADPAAVAALPVLDLTRLAPPIRPGKILCLGYNYAGHVADGADPDEAPPFPNVFVKTPNTIAGPAEPVPLPAISEHSDYEGEIAIVVGRRAKNVPLARAGEHIAGYTLLNDVSSRDWQDRSTQWTLGKCFDKFAPIGPWLVTADDVPDPMNLLLEVIREGEVTVSQSTSTMVFTMEYLVHYISQVLTLEPGDIISSGTPQKLACGRTSHRPLASGDAVTIRVTGLGELTTRFV